MLNIFHHGYLGHIDQPCCGGIGFPASSAAAGTDSSALNDRQMTEFTGCSVKAIIDLLVDNDAAAKTGSQCDHDRIIGILGCSGIGLTESCAVGIVPEKDRNIKGFSEDFWISNLRDFIIWEKVYERKNGKPGISENVWITYSLTQKIFRIGRLQFELIQMPYDECIIGATHILKGQPVINIHIPEDGPFTRKMRYESYSDAYSFYQKMLNLNDDYIPFLCDSWLLFSEHKNMLPESSNIRDFFHDFKIIRDVETPGRLNNLWRVFGFLSQGYSDYQNLPENTTLQRGYKKQLIQNNSTGSGVGVFLYNGQRFIR